MQRKKRTNRKEDEFYRALGFAITQWNQVEHLLFSIFRMLMACDNWHTASAVFFSMQSTRAKIEATLAAAHVALAKSLPLLQEWQEIDILLNEKAGIRNKLAHFIVIHHINDKNIATMYLEPSFHNVLTVVQPKRKKKRTQKEKYRSSQIEKFGKEFTSLALKLHQYHRKLLELPQVKERIIQDAHRRLRSQSSD